MSKPYQKLLGNRVYILLPTVKENNLILSEEAKQQLIAKEIEKLDKVEVYDVGDIVTSVKAGDKVFVDRTELARAPMIPLTKDLTVALISPFHIIHIW